jgi:agmatine/peptidylarginine deiminase
MTKLHFPAEWHTQRAILLTWPHRHSDWNWILSEVEAFYLKLSKLILEYQDLILVVNDVDCKNRIDSALSKASPPHNWHSYIVQSNDTWARDHGPISIYQDNQLTLLDFTFNGWGGKYAANWDNQITQKLLELGAFPDTDYQKHDWVLEGGSIETDGEGTLLTTAPCLLNPNRNPEMDRITIESALSEALGVNRFLWLDHGYLAGDDTDSHIDTLARFCDRHTIAFVECQDSQDEHYEALSQMRETLKTFRQVDGSPYRLIPLPMPDAIYEEGRRLPATYANFLILNEAVLVPIYQQAKDQQAIAALAEAFPNRTIIPVDCRVLIRQNGSLHCITMQIPIDAYRGHEVH